MTDIDRTIPAFCRRHNFGHSTYYRMRAAGHGPRELRIPGSSIIRITPEAEREWEERMQQTPVNNKLIRRATKAGRLAVESPRHPSNMRRRSKPHARRGK
jgi:hypothetical protein